MAYDGIFIKLQIDEIKDILLYEHISKITQKSQKEINFHIHKNGKNYILSLSSDPQFPHMLLSNADAKNLPTPPSFCMLLRKYLQSATIKNIIQIDSQTFDKKEFSDTLERIVKFEFENINENGDIKTYFIYFEIMGKYSNIIITDSDNIILDVLIKSNDKNTRLSPKEKYNISDISNKSNILTENFENFLSNINTEIAISKINEESTDLSSIISKKYSGISKQIAMHLIFNYLKDSGIVFKSQNFNYEIINNQLGNEDSLQKFFVYAKNYIQRVLSDKSLISPTINYKDDKASDLYAFKLYSYYCDAKTFSSLNNCLETFLNNKFQNFNDTNEKKNVQDIVSNLFTKLNKKIDIYKKDLSKCEDLEKYKNYGELISCFGYDKNNIKDGLLICKDYNDNDKEISIPIDESISIAKNVEKYYDKYNKLKRTKEMAENLIKEANLKLEHLNTIYQSLSLSNDKNDIYIIKEELIKYFDETNKISTLKKQKKDINTRKNNSKSTLNYHIHHYKSSSGVDIYVGKNNLQNEFLTFTLAKPQDTWLHIKNATGSHVIVKKAYEELDEKTLIEAASLAAYFSEKRNETKATVDYTLKKELKKVKGKEPGFCIYHKNFSINVKPEILIEEM